MCVYVAKHDNLCKCFLHEFLMSSKKHTASIMTGMEKWKQRVEKAVVAGRWGKAEPAS